MNPLTILGGGPAGLAVAFYAHRHGLDFHLYEKEESLGGLCRTFRCGPHLYDSGAHRFHDRDPEITADLRELLGEALQPVDAPSQVYVGGRFLDFPPAPLNLVLSSHPRQLVRMGFDLLTRRRRRGPVSSFEDLALQRFGPTLARQFLLNYSEKVWGEASCRLSPDIATRRLSGMSLRTLLVELFLKKKKTVHIDGTFLYPRLGYGSIPEALQATLPSSRLHLGREVVGLYGKGGLIRGIHFADGSQVEVDGPLVSTLPLPLLVRILGTSVPEPVQEAARGLRFRQMRLLFLRLAQPSVSPNASIYIPDPHICVSRIYEPKNRSAAMAPPEETSLVAEIPCFRGDPVDRLPAEALFARVARELEELGLLAIRDIVEWRHHFLPNAYPVYDRKYRERVEKVLEHLKSWQNLHTLGRNGLFFYSHLHDQMRFGKDLIRKLARPLEVRSEEPGALGREDSGATG